MDMHLNTSVDLDEAGAKSAPPPRRRGRGALLAGVSALALLGGVGFLASPWNDLYPLPVLQDAARQGAAAVGLPLPATPGRPSGAGAAAAVGIVAPSATLADVSPVERGPPPVRDRFVPPPRAEQLREVLAVAGVPGEPARPAVPSRVAAAAAPPPDGAPALPFAAPSLVAASPGPAARAASVVPGEDAGLPPLATVPSVNRASATAAAAMPIGPPPMPTVAPALGRELAAREAAVVPATIESGQAATAEAAPPTRLPTEAVVAPARSPTPATPPSPLVAALPTAPRPAPAAVATAAAPRDPVTAAMELRAAPMTPTEQLQVLELVTQVATMVRDGRQQSRQVQGDVVRRLEEAEALLHDFQRRLAMAEARAAIAAVAASPAAPTTPPSPAVSTPPAELRPAAGPRPPVQLVRAAAALPSRTGAAPPAEDQKRYRVQAASPGLAMLAEVDRGGGDGAQIQLAVGDTLPGWGRVRSIGQRGTAWVVTTERGAIQ